MTERIVGRPWTDEEDGLLTQAVANHGEHDNWKTIALSVPGRTNKACRKVVFSLLAAKST
jgi:myb proto-oncogene protein